MDPEEDDPYTPDADDDGEDDRDVCPHCGEPEADCTCGS